MEAAREVGIDRRNAIQASKVRIDPASRFGVISSGSSATFAQCPLYLVVDFATDLPTDERALTWPSLVKPSTIVLIAAARRLTSGPHLLTRE
jgi:hypothetical protein